MQAMPPLVALDIAILPPAGVAARAVEVSRTLVPDGAETFQLGGARLPHITMAALFVAAADVDAACAAVGRALADQPVLPLRSHGGDQRGRTLWLGIDRSDALAALHERLMRAVAPFERRGGTAAAFTGEPARGNDVEFVARYRERSAYAAFDPHVTLGHGVRAPDVAPFTFEAREIAACHLGRFCTCRAVIERWVLPTHL